VSERPRPLLLALALFALALGLYARTAGFPFVEYDDPGYVRDNPALADGLTAASVRWAFTSTDYQYNWHPLTWLSHALDVEIFGLDAGRHHLVNALLHALNAALVFLALRALTARDWTSAFAAALFALHPLRVESVAWIAQRKDLLAGTFFALTLLAHARYVRAPSHASYARVALALGAGLMAKPTLVTLPLMLVLLDRWPLRRALPWRALVLEKVPLLALSAIACALTMTAQSAGGAVRTTLDIGARIENALVAYASYLGEFVAPRGLGVLYPHPALLAPESSRLGAALAALALLVALGLGAWRLRRSAPWLALGYAWFLGLLVPMIGLVQVGLQARADRYAYLPFLGLEVALAWSLCAVAEARPRWRTPLVAAGVLWLATLGALSARQLAHWRSSIELFEHTLAVTGPNPAIENNLGLALAGEGRVDEALTRFEAAAAVRPGFHEAELNTGKARFQRGELEAARKAFERAAAARPTDALTHLFLALTLGREGLWERADAELARALELDPRLADDPRARALGQELVQHLGEE